MAAAAVTRLVVVGYSVEAASTIGAMTVGLFVAGTGFRPGFAFLGCTDDDLKVVRRAMIRLAGGLVGVLASILIVGIWTNA
jgi:allophanate hydrolase subunit 1